jgi:lipopolysaccharide transport system ATP-binding protein
MNTVIKVENLSKQYRLGTVGANTFREDSKKWWAKILGKHDPYSNLGEENDRTIASNSNYVWSLKDINFELEKGDVLGVVGKNGAGKSTLLKILSKVTAPTTGSIKAKGRIASLLEVGTGFHPELTGRENIFLNGAILGMRKHEITSKLDEIIAFAGVERYIDTPVKRYSSGMYVRLAFAVAAHLENEILIIDEVLAVGDAEFQKKCLGKMGEVSSKQGRTVLFVSHNLSSIRTLCNKALLLNNGKLETIDNVSNVITLYQNNSSSTKLSNTYQSIIDRSKKIELISAKILNSKGTLSSVFEVNNDIFIEVTIKCNQAVKELLSYIKIHDDNDVNFIESDNLDFDKTLFDNLIIGENKFRIQINSNILPIGKYTLYFSLTDWSKRLDDKQNFVLDSPGDILEFVVVDSITHRGDTRKALTSQILSWEKII